MEYISQLRKASTSALFILSISFLFLSCKKNTPAPAEEQPTVPQKTTFSLVKVDYFLDNGDKVDSTTYQLKSYELQNSSELQVQQTYFEDFQGLNKKSLFTLGNLPADLPKDLNLSSVHIPTPVEINADDVYAVDLGWKMTDTLQQKPFDYLKPGNQVVKIPAKSLIQIDRSIKEYWANVSFSARIKNENTGELHTVTGKWKGTLNFSDYSVYLSQKALKF